MYVCMYVLCVYVCMPVSFGCGVCIGCNVVVLLYCMPVCMCDVWMAVYGCMCVWVDG